MGESICDVHRKDIRAGVVGMMLMETVIQMLLYSHRTLEV